MGQTTMKRTVQLWQKAATLAIELAPRKQVCRLGKPRDQMAAWASGDGLPSYQRHAGAGALAVVFVEWRRPEGHEDEDLSAGGYYLEPNGRTVRVSAHASVTRTADGTLAVGPWLGEDGKERELPALVRQFVEMGMPA